MEQRGNIFADFFFSIFRKSICRSIIAINQL